MDETKQKAAQYRIDRAARTLLEVTEAKGIHIIAVFENKEADGYNILPHVSSHGAFPMWYFEKIVREYAELKSLIIKLLLDRSSGFNVMQLHTYIKEIQPSFKHSLPGLEPRHYASVKNWLEQRLVRAKQP
jgi:hypothetical protein